jgi:hypothetical protein
MVFLLFSDNHDRLYHAIVLRIRKYIVY